MFKLYASLAAVGMAAFFSVAMPVTAQDMGGETADTEESKEADPVLEAWGAFKEKRAAHDEAYKKILADYRAKKLSLEDAKAAIAKLSDDIEPFETAFKEAFAKADPAAYSGEEHAEMLEDGLYMLAQQHSDDEEHAEAVATYEALLKYCPDSGYCTNVKTYYLPMAMASAGDLDAAIKRMSELVEELEAMQKPSLLVRLGDFQAANGDAEGALKSYDKALEEIGDAQLGQRDPRARAKSDAEMRKNLVGTDAPEIDSENWIDGEATPLSGLKGKVVLLDFWATWCPPCRGAMPGLDEVYKAHKEEGFVALGITRYYANGFLPEDSSDLQKGTSMQGIAEGDYKAHVEKFKEISEISYPFVIAEGSNFSDYGVRGIPQMVVIDQQGKIALVAVGGGSEPLIEACVKGLLKKNKADSPTTPEGGK